MVIQSMSRVKEKAKFIEKCIKMPVIELPETPRLESSKPMCFISYKRELLLQHANCYNVI
jgi:hypothetical protein